MTADASASGGPTASDVPPMRGRTTRSQAWSLVARREIVVKLTDRAFLVGTVLTLTLISGFMVVQTVLEQRAQTYAVAAMPEAQAMARTLEQRVGAVDGKVKVTVHVVTSVDAAQAALRDGSADVWLRHGGGGWVLTGKDGVPGGLDAAASTVIRQDGLRANAAALGVSVDEMTRGTTLTTSVLDGNAEKNGFAHGMGFALAFLFYLSSLGFGVTLAQSVLEEKQSRIVEIIATKIPVRQLLAGKVLGNTTMALGQMGLYVSIGLIGLSFTKYSTFLPGVSGALGWFLVFFLVGFLLIACAWAVAGALASRSEDLQQTSAPLTMLMVAVFFGAIFLKGTALTILSFIPPFSAVLMPIRVLSGSAAWWEPVVAVGLLMAAAVGGVLVAERLYRRSLLQTQGRLSLRQAWSSPDLATAPR